MLLFLIIIWFPFTGDIIPNVEGQLERANNRHSFKTRRLTGSTSTTGTNSNSESEEKMDLGSDPTHSSTTSSSTARSSSSHVFTIPESTNIFHEFFYSLIFYKVEGFYWPGTPEQARPARPRSGLDFQIHKVEAT